MKSFGNGNAIFSNHEHRVIPFTQRETVNAVADLSNTAVPIGSEHTGGGDNGD